ncbi:MAG: sugar O-acetyltransferase [Rikenellaceae bacterium]|nr:sugar O-acetyltransferase [Rikenellaceae bacterium]
MDIFERMRAGELIRDTDPGFDELMAAQLNGMRLVGQLNSSYHTKEETLTVLRELTGQDIDESVWVIPPFYTDFGRFIRFGKGVFVNNGCTFMDRGGITLEEGAYVGPNVNIITENHAEQPELRRFVYSRPIVIGRRAWIGAAAVILPGVTVGENAIVAAGAVVTKDVPADTIVAGVPAKVVRRIEAG